ncbi:poly (ADP-ribose) polymerase family, member 8 [Ectocarpus siliculosus]|uniref:Poly (ADP-ribose) polymerase family, member 8 n=1 Tax=Ectocarpus siliculosus TaxID=2880 RepID=D8LRG8_ECTSI|nr:poly (ADP-ribose) polymerase family, member 8 [Ectocarpus siliculosus]|eukprot:CBN75069.1 poly (ADP-ribose) polymerase family, member 8 [Ectocarpus siliculosus]
MRDALTTIQPEIYEFVSQENRSHADPWLQKTEWVPHERTLVLYVCVQAPAGSNCRPGGPEQVGEEVTSSKEELLNTLTRPKLLKIYFPPSLDQVPFCFCEDDVLVPATEAANGRLRPLSCNSVRAVVTTVLQCVKREAASASVLSSGDKGAEGGGGAARARLAAEAVLAAIKEDPLGADLVLALLSMAVSSYRRDTVSTPFPKQLESPGGSKRAYAAFISCLEGIPSMLEMSRWTDAAQVLKLPPVAVVALHLVLVLQPARLRNLASKNRARSAATASCGARASSSWSASSGAGVAGLKARFPAAGLGVPSTASGRSGDGGGGDGGGASAQLGDVPTYAFEVVLPSDPAFDAQAELGGSKVAYHGSSPENFHSILNTGLRVMSGSRLMKNGAVFGNGIYLSGSCKAAATFAYRGDGSGTTVWPRSTFVDNHSASRPAVAHDVVTASGVAGTPDDTKGDSPAGAAATARSGSASVASSATNARCKRFRHRLVAKCRVLNGDGVKEIEGSGKEASYFVVSDASRVRVEAILLFHETQPSSQQHADINSASVDRATTAISSGVGDSGKGGSRAARGRQSGASESSGSDDDEGVSWSRGVRSVRGHLRGMLLEVVTFATLLWFLWYFWRVSPISN